MARKNIFEILAEKLDIQQQLEKIEELLSENSIYNDSLEEVIDIYCIRDWKFRGRCTNCADIRKRLSITYHDIKLCHGNQNIVLNYLEYIANLIWLCNTKYLEGKDDFDAEYQYLQENVIGLIEDLGYETKILEDEERVLLLEKNAAATAAAEITSQEISNKIIEYNHFLLKGNIEEKRKILLALADKFEPVKNELKKVDAILEDNIRYLLNKMNIRHNNKEGKNASGYVSNLTDEELESWYDETYQMLLLSILELDNVERNKKVKELKRMIEK